MFCARSWDTIMRPGMRVRVDLNYTYSPHTYYIFMHIFQLKATIYLFTFSFDFTFQQCCWLFSALSFVQKMCCVSAWSFKRIIFANIISFEICFIYYISLYRLTNAYFNMWFFSKKPINTYLKLVIRDYLFLYIRNLETRV